MKLFICENCGCEIKGERPVQCPLCRKKNAEFSEHDCPDPDTAEKNSTEKYKKALETLDNYEEGCEPQKLKYAFEE